MTARSWRFRRCPACRTVEAASRFTVAGTFRPGWQGGDIRRACPNCGHQAPTAEFWVVREQHAGAPS